MLPIKFKFEKEIVRLIKNRKRIPEEFFVLTDGGKYRAIWFMDRQKPSVEQSYDFDEERFGITIDGRVIWGFNSGCSCPTAWSEEHYGDEYSVQEWKEFLVKPEDGFDTDWQDECFRNMRDYLLLIQKDLKPEEVLAVKNAEIRRYLIKRVGYGRIKSRVKAVSIHKDGTSELLQFDNGEKYVKVKDSSTDREYLLFVHESVRTCRAAIAWTFGLSEQEYSPVLET